MNSSGDLHNMMTKGERRLITNRLGLTGKKSKTPGEEEKSNLCPHASECSRSRNTYSLPLGAVGCLLASTSLSNRRMKAELREMVNTQKVVLPINIVAQEANAKQFGEKDKVCIVYPNVNLLMIKVNIMGVTVHPLLVDSGASTRSSSRTFWTRSATLPTTLNCVST